MACQLVKFFLKTIIIVLLHLFSLACQEMSTRAAISSYMSSLAYVKSDKRNLIPAVTHVDGTARYQTVDFNNNEGMVVFNGFCVGIKV